MSTAAESDSDVKFDITQRPDFSLLTEEDLYLFNEGSHFRLHDKLGSHIVAEADFQGTCFAVWAPNAEKVSVMGDFNEWSKSSHPLRARDQSGIWDKYSGTASQRDRWHKHSINF